MALASVLVMSLAGRRAERVDDSELKCLNIRMPRSLYARMLCGMVFVASVASVAPDSGMVHVAGL